MRKELEKQQDNIALTRMIVALEEGNDFQSDFRLNKD